MIPLISGFQVDKLRLSFIMIIEEREDWVPNHRLIAFQCFDELGFLKCIEKHKHSQKIFFEKDFFKQKKSFKKSVFQVEHKLSIKYRVHRLILKDDGRTST